MSDTDGEGLARSPVAEGEYSECACCGGVDDQDDGDDYTLFSRGSVSTSVVDSVGPRSDGESESSASFWGYFPS